MSYQRKPQALSILLHLVVVCAIQRIFVATHEFDTDAECSSLPPPCSQLCNDTSSGVTCSCTEGYYLVEDGVHCKANNSTAVPSDTLLLYESGNSIMAISLGSSHEKLALSIYEESSKENPEYKIGLEILRGRIFAVTNEEHAIKMIELESKRNRDVIMNGLKHVTGVAVDWITSVLYISDSGIHKILACSTSTYRCMTVLQVHLSNSLEIDAVNKKLYFSECSVSNRIEISDLDGGHRSTLTDGTGCAMNLKLDFPSQTLYWINSGDDEISFYNLATKKNEVIHGIESLYQLRSIAIFEDDLIWSNVNDNNYDMAEYESHRLASILKAHKFSIATEKPDTVVKHLLTNPAELHVWHSSMQPAGKNPCEKKRCSHLCLQATTLGNARCACPTGMIIGADQHTCTVDWSVPSIVYAHQNELFWVNVNFVGGKAGERLVAVKGADNITALAFDWSQKIIYMSVVSLLEGGIQQGSIMRILLNKLPLKEEILFTDVSKVTDIEVDWLAKNLYWVDNDKGIIEVGSVDGLSRAVLVGGDQSGFTEKPRALAVDPAERRLYYSSCGQKPHIGLCDLSGQNCDHGLLIMKAGECVSDLLVDQNHNCLYFIVSSQIMFASLDLKTSELFRHSYHPNSVATHYNQLFWTDELSSDIMFQDEDLNMDSGKITIEGNHTHLGPIIVYSDSVQPPGSSKCIDKGGCSDICLVVGNDTVKCLCDSVAYLNKDNRTCNRSTAEFVFSDFPRKVTDLDYRKMSKHYFGIRETTPSKVMGLTSRKPLTGGKAIGDKTFVAATDETRMTTTATSADKSIRSSIPSLTSAVTGKPSSFSLQVALVSVFAACRCRNGGSCGYDILGGVICLCPEGFSGEDCQEKDEEAELFISHADADELSWGDFNLYVGVTFGVMVIVIIVLLAAICFVRQKKRSGRMSEDKYRINPLENPNIELGYVNKCYEAAFVPAKPKLGSA